jgi:hypothetical protein
MTPPSRKPARKAAEPEPKTEAKSRKPVRGRPFVSGDPRANRTKPGPGRPKDRFKRLCQKLTMRSARKYCRKILRNPNHQHYMSALRWASEHGFGKPDTHLDVAGKITLEQLVAAANQPEK